MNLQLTIILTLIWVGYLGVHFEVGLVKLPPPKTCQNCARNLKFGTYVHTQL